MLTLTSPTLFGPQITGVKDVLAQLVAAQAGLASGAALISEMKATGQDADLPGKIEQAEATLSPEKKAARSALVCADGIVQELCGGFPETLYGQVEEACAPFFDDRRKARNVARETDAAHALGHAFFQPERSDSAPAADFLTQLDERITQLRAILAGEPVWSFGS